jgi:SAM-dependent methyltransferase
VTARATSFGTAADRYDRARPSYPTELVDRLLADGARRVLDVGCGTGKASRLFLAQGCEVLGVEVDERMAAVARSHGVEVEVAPFEKWEPRGRTFELVVSGQAWHWLDPAVALPKVAQVLVPGRRFAAFWNLGGPHSEIAEAFRASYRRHAPDFERENSALFGWGDRELAGTYLEPIAAAAKLHDAEIWSFPWERRYTRDEWLELLQTQSDHILLRAERREALLAELAETIDAHGGFLDVPYVTAVMTAVRDGEQ